LIGDVYKYQINEEYEELTERFKEEAERFFMKPFSGLRFDNQSTSNNAEGLKGF